MVSNNICYQLSELPRSGTWRGVGEAGKIQANETSNTIQYLNAGLNIISFNEQNSYVKKVLHQKAEHKCCDDDNRMFL